MGGDDDLLVCGGIVISYTGSFGNNGFWEGGRMSSSLEGCGYVQLLLTQRPKLGLRPVNGVVRAILPDEDVTLMFGRAIMENFLTPKP